MMLSSINLSTFLTVLYCSFIISASVSEANDDWLYNTFQDLVLSQDKKEDSRSNGRGDKLQIQNKKNKSVHYKNKGDYPRPARKGPSREQFEIEILPDPPQWRKALVPVREPLRSVLRAGSTESDKPLVRTVGIPIPRKKPVRKLVVVPKPKPQVDDSTVYFIQTGGPSEAPVGHPIFCKRNPERCLPQTSKMRVWLSQNKKNELESINTYVNQLITYKEDIDHYGTNDYWATPQKYGDCEDYVLLKEKLLREAGWPRESLAITIVDDDFDHTVGHAVLTVHTRSGDLVLDNQVPEIKYWHETQYMYISLQTSESNSGWAYIQDLPTTAAAGASP